MEDGVPRGDVEILLPGERSAPAPAEMVERLDQISKLLDTAFVIPGTNIRFGVDSLIGLIPFVGDAISTAMSSWLIYEANRLGISRIALARMIGNVAVDGIIGAIPIVGDAFDVAFRANRRNMKILRDQLAKKQRRA
jgi:hypothetical protein